MTPEDTFLRALAPAWKAGKRKVLVRVAGLGRPSDLHESGRLAPRQFMLHSLLLDGVLRSWTTEEAFPLPRELTHHCIPGDVSEATVTMQAYPRSTIRCSHQKPLHRVPGRWAALEGNPSLVVELTAWCIGAAGLGLTPGQVHEGLHGYFDREGASLTRMLAQCDFLGPAGPKYIDPGLDRLEVRKLHAETHNQK
ncbi:hypothetical protein H696_03271 [Fonticula alba]|uniref:Uncharacterized protein n=1 Tax=Fonticula alba TaxID=691883 RepID=A0A058Z6R0_FONAL|nr:hypothetical protein H696_03271 [Fonticula alba]KCV69811.1 hypothetical protein H696_03271 [Fonticula alba]|eukprot:XP_009495417.1 hypothetical protein H696_03271 [Fonticula alba]